MQFRQARRVCGAAAVCLAVGLAAFWGASRVRADAGQQVLGPGLYAYQTRTRSAVCGDAERTGFVSTFIAAIDGVPGDRTMRMKLVNNAYWPEWSLSVDAENRLLGRAKMHGKETSDAESEFTMKLDAKGRFTGVGTRHYTTRVKGKSQRCSVTYDVLLRPLD